MVTSIDILIESLCLRLIQTTFACLFVACDSEILKDEMLTKRSTTTITFTLVNKNCLDMFLKISQKKRNVNRVAVRNLLLKSYIIMVHFLMKAFFCVVFYKHA